MSLLGLVSYDYLVGLVHVKFNTNGIHLIFQNMRIVLKMLNLNMLYLLAQTHTNHNAVIGHVTPAATLIIIN